MFSRIKTICVAVAAAVLLCACAGEPEPTTVPITEPATTPTTEPTTELSTEPPTEQTTEPPTEAIEPLRQSGERLAEAELDLFEALFYTNTLYAKTPTNYYAMATCVEFDAPENLNLLYYFNLGFEQAKKEAITGDELDFFLAESGYDHNTIGDVYRLPAPLVNAVLQYYFGQTADQVTGWSSENWVYNESTDCYYITPPGALMAGRVLFHDGYFDETTGVFSLYYYNNSIGADHEFVIKLKSKSSLGESGYYILSNMPIGE